MIDQGTPSVIVNTGSKQGITNPPGNAAYNASKAALKSYTESLQHELRNTDGCQVSAHLLVPGWTTTGKREHKPGAWLPDQVIDVLLEALARGDFYIVCPDDEVTSEMDTARILWGNEASVLVGDFLLGQAFRMMVETGSLESLRILSNAAAVIAEGEVMQLAASKDTTTTEDAYLEVINAKTAALFSAAAEVGAVVGERPQDEQAALESFGRNLGVAFQLVDDALDYSGKQSLLGKAVGDDFREGKITLPVVLAYRRGDTNDRSFWKRTLEDGDQCDEDLPRAVGLLERHNALADTVERAHHYGAIARDALAIFPDSDHKTALLAAVDFCVNREH